MLYEDNSFFVFFFGLILICGPLSYALFSFVLPIILSFLLHYTLDPSSVGPPLACSAATPHCGADPQGASGAPWLAPALREGPGLLALRPAPHCGVHPTGLGVVLGAYPGGCAGA